MKRFKKVFIGLCSAVLLMFSFVFLADIAAASSGVTITSAGHTCAVAGCPIAQNVWAHATGSRNGDLTVQVSLFRVESGQQMAISGRVCGFNTATATTPAVRHGVGRVSHNVVLATAGC
ncbi:MAG: hypothetical protein FWE07_07375 [Turicibacter sp.]|nr:hypothetical protein [Turicibacter sp.]